MIREGKTLAFIVLWCFLTVIAIPVSAADVAIEEDTLKAVYSFNFGKFTLWPKSKLSDNNTSLGFCIFGKNPFDLSAIDAIEGKQVKGKTLQVEFFESGLLSDDALPSCHIIFVSQSEKLRLQNILDTLRYQPILTVSDIEGFSRNGGMITLIKTGDQIQFEINPDAVNRAGLSISSKLVELAKTIKDVDSDGNP